jgi:hypothetical protein
MTAAPVKIRFRSSHALRRNAKVDDFSWGISNGIYNVALPKYQID